MKSVRRQVPLLSPRGLLVAAMSLTGATAFLGAPASFSSSLASVRSTPVTGIDLSVAGVGRRRQHIVQVSSLVRVGQRKPRCMTVSTTSDCVLIIK